MNFIPCLTWVAKGIAKYQPDKVQLQPEELKALIDETKEEIRNKAASLNEGDDDGSGSEDNDVDKINDDPEEDDKDFDARYNLDAYDDEDDRPFMNIEDIAVYADNKDDEYITEYDVVKEDEEEEKENFCIKENDNLLVVGHVEEESSILEIYVYNKDEDAFYIHHDIVLPAYPLALEWLDFHPSDETGNYLAVGDMTPVIKIWDLDVADILEPDYCLGEKKKKKKKVEKSKLKSHSDAVLSLSWNKHVRNILASGSADSTIILWDLQDGRAANRLEFHTDKVQALQWSPLKNSYLLSGCTDGIIKLYDCRTDDVCKSWGVDGEVEKVLWDLSDSSKFYCSTDTGFVFRFDTRKDGVEYKYKAHDQGVTGLDLCPQRPNILVTASMDNTIKLWNIEKGCNLLTKELKVGSIYSAKFAPDSELVLAIGGNNESDNLKIVSDLCETLNALQIKKEKNVKASTSQVHSTAQLQIKEEKNVKASTSQVHSTATSVPKKTVRFQSEELYVNNAYSDNSKPPKKKKKKLKHFNQSWQTNSEPSTSFNAQTQKRRNNVIKYE